MQNLHFLTNSSNLQWISESLKGSSNPYVSYGAPSHAPGVGSSGCSFSGVRLNLLPTARASLCALLTGGLRGGALDFRGQHDDKGERRESGLAALPVPTPVLWAASRAW